MGERKGCEVGFIVVLWGYLPSNKLSRPKDARNLYKLRIAFCLASTLSPSCPCPGLGTKLDPAPPGSKNCCDVNFALQPLTIDCWHSERSIELLPVAYLERNVTNANTDPARNIQKNED